MKSALHWTLLLLREMGRSPGLEEEESGGGLLSESDREALGEWGVYVTPSCDHKLNRSGGLVPSWYLKSLIGCLFQRENQIFFTSL